MTGQDLKLTKRRKAGDNVCVGSAHYCQADRVNFNLANGESLTVYVDSDSFIIHSTDLVFEPTGSGILRIKPKTVAKR